MIAIRRGSIASCTIHVWRNWLGVFVVRLSWSRRGCRYIERGERAQRHRSGAHRVAVHWRAHSPPALQHRRYIDDDEEAVRNLVTEVLTDTAMRSWKQFSPAVSRYRLTHRVRGQATVTVRQATRRLSVPPCSPALVLQMRRTRVHGRRLTSVR
jgi:hypothetical protein